MIPFGEGFWVKSGEEVLRYSPASDSIHIFEDPKFNHVAFWDEERKTMVWQFMGQTAMDALSEAGLPHTIRDTITKAEFDAWVDWTADNESVAIDEELNGLLGSDGT